MLIIIFTVSFRSNLNLLKSQSSSPARALSSSTSWKFFSRSSSFVVRRDQARCRCFFVLFCFSHSLLSLLPSSENRELIEQTPYKCSIKHRTREQWRNLITVWTKENCLHEKRVNFSFSHFTFLTSHRHHSSGRRQSSYLITSKSDDWIRIKHYYFPSSREWMRFVFNGTIMSALFSIPSCFHE